LKDGGIYVIEDIQTSYWEEMGGDSRDLKNPATAMNFCKQLTDCLNFMEFDMDGYQPSYYDLHIIEIHFYHNLVFVYKGENTEKSNFLALRRNIGGW
jgi:demethylmacrocin O-methyltransferase